MGNQLKYADRRNAPCVIIQGSDEKDDPAGPQVVLKDLILGAELAKLEKDREEYLQKQGEAQTRVPQASLVDEVRRILDQARREVGLDFASRRDDVMIVEQARAKGDTRCLKLPSSWPPAARWSRRRR